MSNQNHKKRGNGLLIAFFCLPLAVILCFTIYYNSFDSVSMVSLRAPETEESEFSTQEDIDFFVNMLKNALPISTAMRDVSTEAPVYITLHLGSDSKEYKFYPSLNLSGCLIVSPEGELFVPETDTAKELLLRTEFDYLYSSYFLPELSVVSGENSYKVFPTECVWNYYKTDDNIYSYQPATLATGNETYVIVKGLENTLSFTPNGEVRPYEMTDISYIADNGSEYNIKDISQLDLSFDTLLEVSFTVKWSGMNGAKASGEAKYKFNLIYDIPAFIELKQKNFTIGDVIIVDATHLNADEKIGLNTTLDIPGIGFGITEPGKGVALLPIGLNNASGEYELEFLTGGEATKETITLKDRVSGAWIPFDVTEEQYNEQLSAEKMESLNNALSSATETRPETNYFDYLKSGLHHPVSNKTPVFTYGQAINLGTNSASSESGERICQGVVYELDPGTSVRSAQAGEVVFSDELPATGNTVVVYHGFGIYTYYYHLESLNVRPGYTLTDGEIIGSAGTTGYTNGKTVLHYAVSIDGVFVDPMWFYN